MSTSILLITPPFTQLNTPYPATAYLKGFLNTKSISSYQADLGIEVTLQLFSKTGLTEIFNLYQQKEDTSSNAKRIFFLKDDYLKTIEDVILFLQGKNSTIAHFIASRNFLPEAERFKQIDDTSWAFGKMGIQDKAKHFATMFLEDLSDFIKECIDPHFGFSRYAEKLARSANSFDEIHFSLQQPLSLIDEILIGLLQEKINSHQPKLVCISVPFPGNVFAALRCGQFIKQNYSTIKVAFGGGFANTELRDIKDVPVFKFIDFITLDDGEAPIENLLKFIVGEIGQQDLKRTFLLENNQIIYINNSSCTDYKQHEVGTPDYSDLFLDQYINEIGRAHV